MVLEKAAQDSDKQQYEQLAQADDIEDQTADAAQDSQWTPSRLRRIFSDLPQKHVPRWLHLQQGTSNDRSSSWSSWMKFILAALCGFFLCFTLDRIAYFSNGASSHSPSSTSSLYNHSLSQSSNVVYTKPAGRKVVGFLFYGRPMFVNVLDCYLRKNLAINGGFLDEIYFMRNTVVEADLDWLDDLVEEVPQYIKVDQSGAWNKLWNYTAQMDPDTIVVKLDDDLVYLHDDSIPRIVTSLLSHPEAIVVAGHVVNNPHTYFWQYHTGAILPYLPENTSDPVPDIPSTWRASALPRYPDAASAPARFKFESPENISPRANMTRWLPLAERSPRNFFKTPAPNNISWPKPTGGNTLFRYDDGYIDHWAAAAQVHYSFLDHLERDADGVADIETVYGLGAGLWDQQWERYSINFLAIRAGDVGTRTLWPTDEIGISMRIPRFDDRRFLVDTRAIVGHFAFSPQLKLLQTDILARYLLYANEFVCAANNQRNLIMSAVHRSACCAPGQKEKDGDKGKIQVFDVDSDGRADKNKGKDVDPNKAEQVKAVEELVEVEEKLEEEGLDEDGDVSRLAAR